MLSRTSSMHCCTSGVSRTGSPPLASRSSTLRRCCATNNRSIFLCWIRPLPCLKTRFQPSEYCSLRHLPIVVFQLPPTRSRHSNLPTTAVVAVDRRSAGCVSCRTSRAGSGFRCGESTKFIVTPDAESSGIRGKPRESKRPRLRNCRRRKYRNGRRMKVG